MASKETFNCKYNLDYKTVSTVYIVQTWQDNTWWDTDITRGCVGDAYRRARYLRNKLHTSVRIIRVTETTMQTSDYELLEELNCE